MTAAPVEILVVSFPESRFSGDILPELSKVVDNGTITVIDGLFVRKDDAGTTTFVEFDELGGDSEVASLSQLIASANGLISDDDVAELSSSLEPGSSAAILVFEHTWEKGLLAAISAPGGVLVEDVHVPDEVVDEVLAVVSELD
jgi:hypothetical protein